METSEGDLRKAITSLQSCARLKSGDQVEIGPEDVDEISGVIPSRFIEVNRAVWGKEVHSCFMPTCESTDTTCRVCWTLHS